MAKVELRARDYYAHSGRFDRTDPFNGRVQQPETLHKYLYTASNPTNFTDLNGLDFSAVGAISAAGLQSTLSSLQASGFSAVFAAVEGVQDDISVQQALVNFAVAEAAGLFAGFGLDFASRLFGTLFARGARSASGLYSGQSAWKIRPDADRKIIADFANDLLAKFTADGGRFVQVGDRHYAGKYLQEGGRPVIKIADGAGAGTFIEEMIHHVQVSEYLSTHGLTWNDVKQDKILTAQFENDVKGIMHSLGFFGK